MQRATLPCGPILGNVAESAVPASHHDQDIVELEWHECPRRALRKHTRGGLDIAILQPPGQVLRHRDILWSDGESSIVVEIAPVEVIIARPSSAQLLGTLAYEIGNLHLPVELGPDELYVIPDGPVEELLEKLGIAWTTQARRFSPIFPPIQVSLSPSPQIMRR